MLFGSDPDGESCMQLLKLSGRSCGSGCSTVGAVMMTSGLLGGGVVGVWLVSAGVAPAPDGLPGGCPLWLDPGTCAVAAVPTNSSRTNRYQQSRRGMTYTRRFPAASSRRVQWKLSLTTGNSSLLISC